MSPELRAFYEFNSMHVEPWDGPASITFTDGDVIGAVLDRNGLRPSRYIVTKDDYVIMASEVGVLPIDEANIAKKGRLQPGKMFFVDLNQGRIISDREIKSQLAAQNPYQEWLDECQVNLENLPVPEKQTETPLADMLTQQIAFGYTTEDLKLIMAPMIGTGMEATGSMGNDASVKGGERCWRDGPSPGPVNPGRNEGPR